MPSKLTSNLLNCSLYRCKLPALHASRWVVPEVCTRAPRVYISDIANQFRVVMSLMSVFASPKHQSPPPQSPTNPSAHAQEVHTSSSPSHWAGPATDSPTPRQRTRAATASSSRPMSMVQAYQPPFMEIDKDVIPELQPIFSFLNSHSNKLYQEGYFLKLNDLDSR